MRSIIAGYSKGSVIGHPKTNLTKWSKESVSATVIHAGRSIARSSLMGARRGISTFGRASKLT